MCYPRVINERETEMNIKTNNRLHRQIMESMKIRMEMAKSAETEAEREEHLKKVRELSTQAGILNNRL
jgi:hypothetical protein